MDLPAEIQIHNQLLGIKGGKGTLVMVSPLGYYEVKLAFGQNVHRVLLPVGSTVIVFREPEVQIAADLSEIER